jgi:hypothetical protein
MWGLLHYIPSLGNGLLDYALYNSVYHFEKIVFRLFFLTLLKILATGLVFVEIVGLILVIFAKSDCEINPMFQPCLHVVIFVNCSYLPPEYS